MAGFAVAVCTNRLADIEARWEHTIALLAPGEFVVVLDTPDGARVRALAAGIRSRGGEVLHHGGTRGLSAARNSVLDARPRDKILFIDDDVLLTARAVAAVRAAFVEGYGVVGVRLVPPPTSTRWPWFFTAGQMHLVGWHGPRREIKTWGACMGLDAAFAHRHLLRFEASLGRTGRRLESGDDTTFVSRMKAVDAREKLLSSVAVVHDVDQARLTWRYLLRRVYWQGRSEVRRAQAAPGLVKEWRRHRDGDHKIVLPFIFAIAYLAGICHEHIAVIAGDT